MYQQDTLTDRLLVLLKSTSVSGNNSMSSKSELQALSERDRISAVSHIFTTAFLLLQLSNGGNFSVNAVPVPDPG